MLYLKFSVLTSWVLLLSAATLLPAWADKATLPFQQGVFAMRQGDLQTAYQIFTRLHQKSPNHPYITYYLAITETRLKKYDAAKAHYGNVLQRVPAGPLAQLAQEGIERIDLLNPPAETPSEPAPPKAAAHHGQPHQPSTEFKAVFTPPEPRLDSDPALESMGSTQVSQESDHEPSHNPPQYQENGPFKTSHPGYQQWQSDHPESQTVDNTPYANESIGPNPLDFRSEGDDVQPQSSGIGLSKRMANLMKNPFRKHVPSTSPAAQSAPPFSATQQPSAHASSTPFATQQVSPQPTPAMGPEQLQAMQQMMMMNMMMGTMGGMGNGNNQGMGNMGGMGAMNPMMMQMMMSGGMNAMGNGAMGQDMQSQMDPNMFSTMLMNQMMSGMDFTGKSNDDDR